MDQKIIIITSGDVNRVLDNCETRNALGEIGIDITWCGYNVAIKRFISFTDMLSFVDGVVSGCFAKSDNRYLPEVRDLFFRCSLVEFYTNIVLPESVEEKNQIVYGTDIIDLILQNIDRGQFRAIMDGIEKRVTYLVNTDMKRIEDDAELIVKQITEQFEMLNDVFAGINGDEMAAFIKAVTKMNFDEKALIEAAAAIGRQNKQQSTAADLKVVR